MTKRKSKRTNKNSLIYGLMLIILPVLTFLGTLPTYFNTYSKLLEKNYTETIFNFIGGLFNKESAYNAFDSAVKGALEFNNIEFAPIQNALQICSLIIIIAVAVLVVTALVGLFVKKQKIINLTYGIASLVGIISTIVFMSVSLSINNSISTLVVSTFSWIALIGFILSFLAVVLRKFIQKK